MRVERINSVQTAAYQLAMLRPTRMGDRTMNMSSESLLVILFVGLVAGWLAGQIVRGTGFGIVGDLIVGILGALIGSWLLPQLVQRFRGSNHIKRPRQVCKTKYG
jgi:uncharacterized membrane protein YeaQ/YmgE (transglycosylase-associated protein family)